MQVKLEYESDAWMMVKTESGRSGLVPSNFLRIVNKSHYNQPFTKVRQM